MAKYNLLHNEVNMAASLFAFGARRKSRALLASKILFPAPANQRHLMRGAFKRPVRAEANPPVFGVQASSGAEAAISDSLTSSERLCAWVLIITLAR